MAWEGVGVLDKQKVFCERFEQPMLSIIPFVLLLVILPLTGISLTGISHSFEMKWVVCSINSLPHHCYFDLGEAQKGCLEIE